MTETTRKLASIRKINEIRPIPEADAIECAMVGGWPVVIKKGEFKPGDLAVYLEIDSWVPHELTPFLSKGKEPREYNGVKGERLRTLKLRGQISQGLLLPSSILDDKGLWPLAGNPEGHDLSAQLGIQKWEPPIPAQLQGTMKGNFPSFIPKTDQPRVQNLTKELEAYRGRSFEVTEKLEGTSFTCYIHDDTFNVCSRNINLKESEGNTYWSVARVYNIEEKLREFGYQGLAIQSEIVGPGVQKNIYNLKEHQFFVFDVYDIKGGRYFTPQERRELCNQLGFKHAPFLGYFNLIDTQMGDILSMADGFSKLNDQTLREGVVFKSECGTFSFKSISNQYLLKSKL